MRFIRFRHKEGENPDEPPQIYGSNQIEVAWTVIPILIVFVLIGVTARVWRAFRIRLSRPEQSMTQ